MRDADTRRAFAGGDLAFKRDSAALFMIERDEDMYEGLEAIELRPERGQPLKPSIVYATFADALLRRGIRELALDGHYIESAREGFAARGITVIEAPGTRDAKAAMYLDLRGILNERRYKLPHLPRLAMQMKAIQKKPTPGGGVEISSPRKGRTAGHGDLVSALVLATWLAHEWIPYRPRRSRHVDPERALEALPMRGQLDGISTAPKPYVDSHGVPRFGIPPIRTRRVMGRGGGF